MIQRRTYDIVSEPSGVVLRQLLTWALGVATQLGLVVHSRSVKLSPSAVAFLGEMNPYLAATKEVGQWPGTQLIGDRRGILRLYRFGPASVEIFVSAADRLFTWVNPLLPEDPHLLRADGSVVLGTVTQEEDAWMELSNDEFETLVRDAPSVARLLRIRG
jgi:hypothetical protein